MNQRQILIIYLILRLRRRKRLQRRRRFYIRPVHLQNAQQRCEIFHRYYNSMHQNDLRGFIRFNKNRFDALYALLADQLRHPATHRFPISGKERLAIFLRYLTTGLCFGTLAHEFGLGKQTISEIVHKTANAVIRKLKHSCMPIPNRQKWLENATAFENRWGFPHCVLALDGKHFACKQPKNSGSCYYNYKGFFSIVLLAAVDSDYRFVLIDIGGSGRRSDSSLFADSQIKLFLESPRNELPIASTIPGRGELGAMPYVVLADGGFGTTSYMMTPFPERSANTNAKRRFNHRLSTARQVVESTFGILVSRFRLFSGTVQLEPEPFKRIIYAAILLHNFLIQQGDEPREEEMINHELINPPNYRPVRAQQMGVLIRNRFVNFFTPL